MNLIIGVDPGITTAIAVLDMHGKLVLLKSSKNYGLQSVIKDLASLGEPLIISVDVSKLPESVQLIAHKFKSLTVAPVFDLKHDDKRKLVADYIVKFNNYHERDALSAAVYAFKRYESLINKVYNKAGEAFELVVREVLLKEVKDIDTGVKKYKASKK